jgi:PAN domain
MQQVKAICVLCAAIIPTLVLAAPASVGDNKFVFVPQSDSPGNDYSTVENLSFEECARKCDDQSECNAFTYNQLHSACFLKLSANRAITFYALATTGVKLSPSMHPTAGATGTGASFVMLSQTDSPGNDYSQLKNYSLEECRSSCDADDICHSFTYNLARGECFLKRATNQWTNFYAWGITGIKLSPLEQSPTTTEENQAEAPKARPVEAPSMPAVSSPEQ